MIQTIAERLTLIEQAERHLANIEPGTEAWLNAQRIVIHGRAQYWRAMRQDWDLNHPPSSDDSGALDLNIDRFGAGPHGDDCCTGARPRRGG